jgi:outer membrane protein OmpA-like peptidoglycan-associated protein
MNHRLTLFLCLTLLIGLTADLGNAQFRDQGIGGGLGFGTTFGQTDLKDQKADFFARAYLRYPLMSHLFGELGAGMGRVSGTNAADGSDYKTLVAPIDYRFLYSPLSSAKWAPYLYAGAGVLHYDIQSLPSNATPGIKTSSWTTVIPAGAGVAMKISDKVAAEVSGGFNWTMKQTLNGVMNGRKDDYWTATIGLTYVGESGSADPDNDGLTNSEEKIFGTDPKNPDTDGDGLKDGDEVKIYHTNPLKFDTDGDGLSDGDEVLKYHTDPLKVDTDGDGLSDGDEVLKYHTDPLKVDTDGDGLSDGDEVLKYHTDPLKVDTDGDGLSDGDEVLRYHTDPLKSDTDGGGVNDGVEVARGTNPLDPSDDIPKKEELKVEVGKAIVLEGIVFATGKATIQPESEPILQKAYNTLAQNADVAVEIRGYTDNVGKTATNQKLSLARAEAVKAWLVKSGIDASRVASKGYGPKSPVASNKTAAGRQQNRRIEFFRTK